MDISFTSDDDEEVETPNARVNSSDMYYDTNKSAGKRSKLMF
jgi:hypothetical protein